MVNVNKAASPLLVVALGAAALAFAASQGCAAGGRYEAAVAKLTVEPPLAADHFSRDHHGGLSEEGLSAILAAPIILDQTQRVGVVPVARAYAPDWGLPLPGVPAELARSLESAGLFPAISEVSTPASPACASSPAATARATCSSTGSASSTTPAPTAGPGSTRP